MLSYTLSYVNYTNSASSGKDCGAFIGIANLSRNTGDFLLPTIVSSNSTFADTNPTCFKQFVVFSNQVALKEMSADKDFIS